MHRIIFFPGGFKPVHAGHIYMILNALNTYKDADIYVIPSNKKRGNISADTTIDFMKKVFAAYPNVHILQCESPSPLRDVYAYTGEKTFGDGFYAMLSSEKEDDIVRSIKYVEGFSEGGKYYTNGVIPFVCTIDAGALCFSDGVAISSTILRNCARLNTPESKARFFEAYSMLINSGMITIADVEEYYTSISMEIDDLLESYNNVLNEGGVGGHMYHPYELDDMTFDNIDKLIKDLLDGNIEDVTEKLDGQNLFASMNEQGDVIFARNMSHIKETPWTINDITGNQRWQEKPSVLNAFSNGAKTVKAVFDNIPNNINFFNIEKISNSVRTRIRKWVNLEILDPSNTNVIPYIDAKISFHTIMESLYSISETSEINGAQPVWQFNEDSMLISDMKILDAAVRKTQKSIFIPQMTPKVLLQKTVNASQKYEEYHADILDILNDAGPDVLSMNSTIGDYKSFMILDYIMNSAKFKNLSGEVKWYLACRWAGINKDSIITLKKKVTREEYGLISNFDKNDAKTLCTKIMAPLDTLFMKVGNDVIRNAKGLMNAGKEQQIEHSLKSELAKLVSEADSWDEQKKNRLERLLIRLDSVRNEINAAEGVVIKWNGLTLKLTGSFAPLNAILGLQKYGK